MNKHTIAFNAGMLKRILEHYGESYSDDTVKMTLVSQTKLEALYEVETDLDVDATVNYLKADFKKSKFASALYYTVKAK